MKLIQIVPRFSTPLDGISDYSLILARRLRSLHGIETHFLACEPGSKERETIDNFAIQRLADHSAQTLGAALQELVVANPGSSSRVVLQFAPYGYEQRGCPLWLLKGLRRWKRNQSSKFISMFHELDARGTPPWKSSFWLNPLQRHIIKGLADASERSLTNNTHYSEILRGWGINELQLSPTFSNIGEPLINTPMAQRERQMVVFGRPWQRQRSYMRGRDALIHACNLIEAESILDIGSPIDDFNEDRVGGVPLKRCGRLPATEVSRLLNSSVACFIYYPQALLTKSGVYAACCAHGAIPFVASDMPDASDIRSLIDGIDFVLTSKSTVLSRYGISELQRLSTEIYKRYQSRSSFRAAELYAKIST